MDWLIVLRSFRFASPGSRVPRSASGSLSEPDTADFVQQEAGSGERISVTILA
jgi:hypothetical protein